MTVGHSHQKRILELMQRADAVPHTLIFSGPEHLGKKHVALSFFATLIGTGEAGQKDETEILANILSGLHSDVLVCGEEEVLSVETVQRVRRFVRLSPMEAGCKCVLIDNAHHLGRIGANTLLKTLEEPASKTYTILTTARPERLPATIRSRATLIPFSPCPQKEVLKLLPHDKRPALKKELGWIAGRPGLLKRWAQDQNDPEVFLRRTYFFEYEQLLQLKGVAARLSLAEKITKAERPELALEGILLAARHHLLKNPTPHATQQLRQIREAQERLRFSNVNARLALEFALLPN